MVYEWLIIFVLFFMSCSEGYFNGYASSFVDGLDEELTTYNSAVLASLEEDYDLEAFDRTSAQSSRSHRYLLKSNPVQKNKVHHSDPANQLLCSSVKCRGTKDNK